MGNYSKERMLKATAVAGWSLAGLLVLAHISQLPIEEPPSVALSGIENQNDASLISIRTGESVAPDPLKRTLTFAKDSSIEIPPTGDPFTRSSTLTLALEEAEILFDRDRAQSDLMERLAPVGLTNLPSELIAHWQAVVEAKLQHEALGTLIAQEQSDFLHNLKQQIGLASFEKFQESEHQQLAQSLTSEIIAKNTSSDLSPLQIDILQDTVGIISARGDLKSKGPFAPESSSTPWDTGFDSSAYQNYARERLSQLEGERTWLLQELNEPEVIAAVDNYYQNLIERWERN